MGFYPSNPPAPPRAILGALAAGKSATPPVGQSGPDAELIALCAKYDDLSAQRNAISVAYGDISDKEREAAERPFEDLIDATLDQICSLRATTLEGFKARGRTYVTFAPEDVEDWQEDYCHDHRMLGALLRDLADGNIVPPPVKAPVPDEALIVACNRLVDIYKQKEVLYEVRHTCADELRTQAEMDALSSKSNDLLNEISNLPDPTTTSGAKAMARFAIAFADRDLEGNIATTNDGDWLGYAALEFFVGGGAQ